MSISNKNLSAGRASDMCSYKGCENRRDATRKLFRFPTTDVQRREIWIRNCANSDLIKRNITTLVKSGVCAVHFAEDAFLTPDRLKSTAVPVDYNKSVSSNNSVKIMEHDQSGINDSSFELNSSFAEQSKELAKPTMTDAAINDLMNKVNRLDKENHQLRKELRVLKKKFMNSNDRKNRAKARADKFTLKTKDVREMVLSLSDLAAGAKAMICLQLHTANAPFSEEEKNLAKLLHYYSPVGMSRLRQAGCNFPSSSTMKRLWITT